MALAVLAIASVAASTSHAQTPPPVDGDWVVKDDTTVTGESIVIRGGVTVAPTGKLTLIDVDLTLTCSTYEPWILVQASGELVIKDRDGDPASTSDSTHLTNSATDQGSVLTFSEGSKGLVSCSFLTRVSILALNDRLTVTGCTIEEDHHGSIVGRGCDLTVERTTILNALSYGVYSEGGSLQMDWCTVNGTSANGVTLIGGTVARVSNCSVDGAAWYGAYATASTVIFEDCTFSNSFRAVNLYNITGCVLRRCIIRYQELFAVPLVGRCYGLFGSRVDKLLVTECEFDKLNCITVFIDGTVTLQQCNFSRCRVGLSLDHRPIAFSGCVFRENRVGIEITDSGTYEQIIEDCAFYENGVGIEVMNPSSSGQTIEGCIIEDSQSMGVTIEGHEGETTSAKLRNCTISGSGMEGVYVVEGSVEMDRCNVTSAHSGISVLSGSTAVLRNCTIAHCVHGVEVRNSTAVIEDCDIAYTAFGCDLVDAAGSALRRCNISYQEPYGYALYMDGTGKIAITGCSFKDSTRMLLTGDVDFKDNVVDGSQTGVIIGDGHVILTGCTFSSNVVGASVVGKGGQRTIFESCTFVGNEDDGVVVGAPEGGIVMATLRNCTFERNGLNGVRIDDDGRCVLVDPRLSSNGEHGVYCARNGTVEWKAEAYSSSTNESSDLRGNVTIGPHGTLELTNATLQFVNEGDVAYGVSVQGGTFVMEDLDGDPSTQGDASRVWGEEGSYPDYLTSDITVTGGGVLDASCSRFTKIPVTVEGGRLELSGCAFEAWMNDCIILRNSSGTSVVRGCDFIFGGSSIKAWNSPLDVDDCFMNSYVCIEAHACGSLSISRTTLRGWYMSLYVNDSAEVDLEGLVILDAEMGVTMNDVDDLSITDTVIAGCYRWGLSLLRCNATIASSIVRDTGDGMCAAGCAVVIDGLVIRGCDGSGLTTLQSTLRADGLRVNETGDWAAELSGGTVDLTDSYLDSLGDKVLLAKGDAIVRCYNTTIEDLRVDVGDSAVVEMYHHVRVTVTLMDGGRLPRSLWIVLTSAMGIEALNAPLGPSASTGWVWLEQVAFKPEGKEWHTPWTATVSLAGRSFTDTFAVSRRTDRIIELPHQVVASIAVEEKVYEGIETTLDGTASHSFPFELATLEWDIDYDGVFAPDGWGGRLWWTFDANGTRKVALRVTDTAGGKEIAVVEVAVLDLGPSASIIPPPPGEIAEDALVELDGRVTWAADPVEFISWDLGDGRVVVGSHPIVSWPRAGSYVVTLTVVDMDGSRATARAVMTVVNQPPVAVVPSVRLVVGKRVPFVLYSSRSSDTPSDMPSLRFEWVVEGIGTFEGDKPTVTIDAVGEYHVTLRVTDTDGASSTADMSVVVVNSPPIVGRLDDIAMRQTDMPVELSLGRKVTDPDDDARNITVVAVSSRPDLVGVEVRRLDDGTYVLTISPVRVGGAAGKAVVTVTARDGSGGSAQGTFNITLLTVPKAQSQGTAAWVLPSFVLSTAMVLVAVVLLRIWAKARRAGPPGGAP